MTESIEKERMSKAKNKAELTEAEWEIMKIVWDKEPCAAGTVQEELAIKSQSDSGTAGKAYSTIKTTMDRMAEKGFLQIEKVRNVQLFKSCISEIEAKRGEFRKMLKRAFDGALTPMMQFLIEHEGISKEQATQLRELVRESEDTKDEDEK